MVSQQSYSLRLWRVSRVGKGGPIADVMHDAGAAVPTFQAQSAWARRSA